MKYRKIVQILILGGFLLYVYIATMAKDIYIEDSAEFITAAYTLGVPHSSGYPLYILLAKVFTFLPLGSIAFRVNLLSVISSVVAIILFYLILRKKNIIFFSVSGALLLGFSAIWWSQSIIAEVYTLHVVLSLLSIYFLLQFADSKKYGFLYLTLFFLGLAIANHTLAIFLLVPYLYYLLSDEKKYSLITWKHLSISFLSILPGFLLYLYIPLRVFGQAVYRWNNLENWYDIKNFLLRSNYSDIGLQTNFSSIVNIINDFFINFSNQFSFFFLVFSLGGFLYLFSKKRRESILWLLILFSQVVPVALFRDISWSSNFLYNNRVYYLLSYLILIYFAVYFLNIVYNFDYFSKKKLIIYLNILLVVVIFLQNFYNYNLSSYCFANDYRKKLLLSLPAAAVLLLHGDGYTHDTNIFISGYTKYTLNEAKHIIIIDNNNMFPWPFKESISDMPKGIKDYTNKLINMAVSYSHKKNLPLYTTFPVEYYTSGLKSIPNGVTYQIVSKESTSVSYSDTVIPLYICGEDDYFVQNDIAHKEILSSLYYARSAWYWAHDKSKEYIYYLQKAIFFDPKPFSQSYKEFIFFRNEVLENNSL